ncbi:MAG: hypothetical protein ACTHOH_15395, partial [Lysobacteraceae bacterium]
MATLKRILEAARLIEPAAPPAAAPAEDADIDAIIRRAAEAETRGARAPAASAKASGAKAPP